MNEIGTQFTCINDVINAVRHIAWDNLQPGELICFHKDLKERHSRKGENGTGARFHSIGAFRGCTVEALINSALLRGRSESIPDD